MADSSLVPVATKVDTFGMTDRREETVLRGDFPEAKIVVTVPADVWRQQDSGLPGFVTFAVYEVTGVSHPDGTLLYPRKGWQSSSDTTENIDEAEQFAYGDVKWDGCVNYMVGDKESMLHACGFTGLRLMHGAIVRAYQIACEMVGCEEDD